VKLVIVAAVARNMAIGSHGELPWHMPEDLAHFRALTTGHPVLMGRRTWESIPDRFRPLPGRRNVVLTRSAGWTAEGAERAASLEDALELLADEPEVFAIGGARVYADALPHADVLELTELGIDVDADTFFPSFDRSVFVEVSRDPGLSAGGIPFAFVRYERT
jgi:dihydrofolate reductase